MRAPKKKRLEAKGWKVGGAAEFLGLAPTERASVEARLRRITSEPHDSPSDEELNEAAARVVHTLHRPEKKKL